MNKSIITKSVLGYVTSSKRTGFIRLIESNTYKKVSFEKEDFYEKNQKGN